MVPRLTVALHSGWRLPSNRAHQLLRRETGAGSCYSLVIKLKPSLLVNFLLTNGKFSPEFSIFRDKISEAHRLTEQSVMRVQKREGAHRQQRQALDQGARLRGPRAPRRRPLENERERRRADRPVLPPRVPRGFVRRRTGRAAAGDSRRSPRRRLHACLRGLRTQESRKEGRAVPRFSARQPPP